MDDFIALYQKQLNLTGSVFLRIDHHDAMVGVVYKIVLKDRTALLLKIYSRANDYLRELYFLRYFSGKLPVPHVIDVVPPEEHLYGAILEEYLPGRLVLKENFTDKLAFDLGELLARIHLHRLSQFGDLIQPQNLNSTPHVHFTLKFLEGIDECSNHIPQALIEHCRTYYDKNLYLLQAADGPCIIHRDFRAGNVIIHHGKIEGIIDWASARSSFAEDDFCPMEHGEWPSCPSSKQSFLSGYASVRPVPEYSAIMPLLRLNRAIAIIGFTVKRGTWDNRDSQVYRSNRQFIETFFKELLSHTNRHQKMPHNDK